MKHYKQKTKIINRDNQTLVSRPEDHDIKGSLTLGS